MNRFEVVHGGQDGASGSRPRDMGGMQERHHNIPIKPEWIDAIRNMGVALSVGEAERTLLQGMIAFESLPSRLINRGDSLYAYNDFSAGVNILKEGSIAMADPLGKLSAIKDGFTFLGYESFAGRNIRTGSATALTPCEVSTIMPHSLVELMDTNPSVKWLYLINQASDSSERDIVASRMSGDSLQRLSFLVEEFRRREILEIPFYQERIARLLGVSREQINRTYGVLRQKGVISTTGTKMEYIKIL